MHLLILNYHNEEFNLPKSQMNSSQHATNCTQFNNRDTHDPINEL